MKINSVEMIDELRNKYFFENALVNLKNNELIADGIKIDFFKESFGNNEMIQGLEVIIYTVIII